MTMTNRKRRKLARQLKNYESQLLRVITLQEITIGLLDKTKGPTLTTAKETNLREALEYAIVAIQLYDNEITRIKELLAAE